MSDIDLKTSNISIDRLIDYGNAYDEFRGSYPESEFEGTSLLLFILECEGLIEDSSYDDVYSTDY